jgi:hypothetical protein
MVEFSDSEKRLIKQRVAAVNSVFTAFDALNENGVIITDRGSPIQISCVLPQHGPDKKPSARYYPGEGGEIPHFYCFKCKVRMNSVEIHAKSKGITFFQALSELEKRFDIKPPKKSDQIDDNKPKIDVVARLFPLAEKKLRNIRNKCGMNDYIKICRTLDSIDWDLRHGNGKPTPEMEAALKQILEKIRNLDSENSHGIE